MRRVNPFILSTVSLAAIAASPACCRRRRRPRRQRLRQQRRMGQDARSVRRCRPAAAPVTSEAITVTGSRIRRPNLELPLPVTSVGGEEFFQTGDVSVGDKLAELPSIASTFRQANSTRFLGTVGPQPARPSRPRHGRARWFWSTAAATSAATFSARGVSVDVNTIPTDLIERVDVVTGGNSAVYGSDAIAGVVNFVLKEDYDGIQLRGQGGTANMATPAPTSSAALVGKNFADGRGNVAVNVEYARRDQAWGAERNWLRHALTVVDSDPAGTPNGSDGIPDRILNRDFRSTTFNNTGLISFGAGTGAFFNNFNCGTPPLAVRQPDSNRLHLPLSVPAERRPGAASPASASASVRTASSSAATGEGFFNGHQIQVMPQLDRYNINLVGHFEVSPALVPFIEAKFSRTNSVGQGGSGPAFITGGSAAASGALGDFFEFLRPAPQPRADSIRQSLSDRRRRETRSAIMRTLRGQTCTDSYVVRGRREPCSACRTVSRRRGATPIRIVGGIRGDSATAGTTKFRSTTAS